MDFKLNVPKNNRPNEWFNAIKFEKGKGTIVGVISIRGGDNFDAHRAGGLLVKQLEMSLVFKDCPPDKEITDWLRSGLKDVRDRLLRLVEFDKDVQVELIDLILAVVYVYEDVIYLAKMQGAGIYIKRDGQIINLSNRLLDPTGLNQIFVGSGLIKPGDSILLSSKYSSEVIPEEEFEKVRIEKTQSDRAMLEIMFTEAMTVNKREQGELLVDTDADNTEKAYGGSGNIKAKSTGGLEEVYHHEGQVQDHPKQEIGESKGGHISADTYEQAEVEREEGKIAERFREYLINTRLLALKVSKNLLDKINHRGTSLQQTSANSQEKLVKDDVEVNIADSKNNEPTYKYILHLIVSYTKILVSKGRDLFDNVRSRRGRKMHLRGAKGRIDYKNIGAIILVLVIALYYGGKHISNKNAENKKREQFNAYINEADDYISKATEMSALNKTRAKSYLNDSLQSLSKAEELGIESDEIPVKKSQVLGMMDELEGIRPVAGLEIIFDSINSYESDGVVDMTLSGKKVFVLDNKERTVYMVDIETGSTEKILENMDLENPLYIEKLSDGNVVVYDDVIGLVKIDVAKKEGSKIAGLSPITVGKINELELFSLDNSDILYTLKPEEGRIDKLPMVGGSFSSPQVRIEGEEIKGAVDLAIDGNIYLLTNTGDGIIRYFAGDRIETKIAMEDLDVSGFKAFDVTPKTAHLYVLDSKNKKILILSKPTKEAPNALVVREQLVYRGDKDLFSNFKEVAVDDSESNLYILDGSRVLKIPLK